MKFLRICRAYNDARREPTILSLDIAGNVKQKLEDLAQLLPEQNVTFLVGKAPRLLTSDVSGVAQKVSYNIPVYMGCPCYSY